MKKMYQQSLFDGRTYEPAKDESRLTGHLQKVLALMSDGRWRTLDDIAGRVGCSEASASARLRDLRKPRFGSHTVERQRIEGGLFVYRLAK